MSQVGTGSSPEAGDYGVRLRRRWWVVLLGVLLGVGAALAFTAAQPTTYSSSTSVLVQSTGVVASTSTGPSHSDVNMDTESSLVASEQVADGAKALLKTTTSPTDLLANLTVTVPPNSQVLQLDYADQTARAAQAGAQAFAQAYLDYRTGTAKKDLDASNTSLKADLTDAQAQLRSVTDKIAALPANSPDRTFAEAQRSVLGNQISTLAARLSALDATSPVAGQIITAADLPDSPSSPVVAINLAAGIVVGLLLGLALAVLADRLDHRLRHPSDVQRLVGLPVLAVLPVKGGEAAEAAAYDRLRNTLTSSRDGAHRLLQVSDVGEGGAGGQVAVSLAQSLVRAHGEATLVLAGAHSDLAGTTSVEGRDGLSEVLHGSASISDVRTRVADLPGVWVVPAGRDPEAVEGLLQSDRLKAVLAGLLESTPAVVVETAGTGRSAGAQAVAAASDAVLLVAERGHTHDRVLSDAADGAAQMGARVPGAVLTTRRPRRSSRRRPEAGGSSPATARRDVPADEPVDAAPAHAVPFVPEPPVFRTGRAKA